MTRNSDTQLQSFFDAAQNAAPQPSDALMARILADAQMHLPAAEQTVQIAQRQTGFFAGIVGLLGGWSAVAGLATATVAGVWIGFSAPVELDGYASVLLPSSNYGAADLMPTIDSFLAEDGV